MDNRSIIQHNKLFYIFNGITYLLFFIVCFRYFIYMIRAMFDSTVLDILNIFIYFVASGVVLFLIVFSLLNRLREKVNHFIVIDLLLSGALFYIFFDEFRYLIHTTLFMVIVIIVAFLFYLTWLLSLFGYNALTRFYNKDGSL